jgi:PAS domain S-box-containing protein
MESLRQGEALTDQIWQGIATMRSEEEQLLLQRRNTAQSSARICQIIIVTGSGLACAIGVGAFLMAQRGLQVQSETRRKLEESRTLMESILDNTPAIVFIKDLAGRYLFVNRRFTEVFGRSRGEIIGKTAFDIARKRQAEAANEHFKTVMSTGKAVEIEETVEYSDGLRPHLAVKFPVRDPSGKIWAMAGISTDITERKLAEEKMSAANEQLRASNQELEAFSYSVSHDLRAPLRHIDGFVGLLRKQTMPKLDEKEVRYLNTIAGSAKQMGALIDDLLIFSRMNRTEMRRATVSMNSLVDEVIKAMHNEIEGRQIRWKIAALPDVEGDFAMLRQVLVNLIGNAVKYTRARNPAEIEMGCDDAPADERIFYVRDNGVGFDMQYVHKLFGVFQRLHRADEFEGTGIGLANVRRIVSRHGGRTWADGTLDEGATFYFSLPKQNNNQKDDHGSLETDTAGRG